MAGKLESALVIVLRDSIRWESSLDYGTSTSGTLVPVNPAAVFDPQRYQYRDRQLSYRDLINAAAIVEVAVDVSDVYNYPAPKPMMEGPVWPQMPAADPAVFPTSGTNFSQVRHVGNTSIAYDAARYADADLYGRDYLIFETLARAAETAFTVPSITRLDAAGTVIPSSGSTAWSLAQGQMLQSDINSALPLNRDLFKLPDRNLADRDNQMAGYTARLLQVFQNPFAFAERLFVQISGTEGMEPEVYALISDDGVDRTWVAEPALSNRNQIKYSILDKTLTWTRENVDEVHVPQLYAMSIPGIEVGQTVDTIPSVPDRKDAQFWRAKAGQIVPEGQMLTDGHYLNFTASDAASDGLLQIPAASMTVPDRLILTVSSGSLEAGPHRVSLLVKPQPIVEIAGASNTTQTSGTLGGATWETNVASGAVAEQAYLVEGGDGVVYLAGTYLPGDVFYGTSTSSVYNQVGASASTVRQYATSWALALPPGAWSLTLDYTNLTGNTTGFGVRAEYVPSSSSPVDVIQDIVPLAFSGANGDLVTSPPGYFDVATPDAFRLNVLWTYGDGDFHLRQLTFESTDNEVGRFDLSGTLGTGTARVNVTGQRYQPDVMKLDMTSGSFSPVVLTLQTGTYAELPLQVVQVHIQSIGTYTPTALSSEFQGWRQECVERAERAVQQSWNEAISAYRKIGFPVFYTAGTSWNYVNTENWMSVVEVKHPRLREMDYPAQITPGRQYEVTVAPVVYGSDTYQAGDKFYGVLSTGTLVSSGSVKQVGAFAKAKPGHIGKPCLVPLGIEFVQFTDAVIVNLTGTLCMPIIAACQPWMVEAGFYAAQSDFWTPDFL